MVVTNVMSQADAKLRQSHPLFTLNINLFRFFCAQEELIIRQNENYAHTLHASIIYHSTFGICGKETTLDIRSIVKPSHPN